MNKSFRDLTILFSITLVSIILIWLPHILAIPSFYGLDFSNGFNTIYRNYDGIEYIAIAKSLYDPQKLAELPQSLPAKYYAAHFPGYALAILAFSPVLGFLKSMLFTSLLFTFLSVAIFYKLVKDFKLTDHPLFLSILFLFLPARWVIVHSVGGSEPVFIFFVIATIYSIMKFELHKKTSWIWLASIAGFAAQFTRPPGFLLTAAISIYLLWTLLRPHFTKHYDLILEDNQLNETSFIKLIRYYYPLLLLPAALLAVFYWYLQSYGDFWMYFKTGDNIHLTFPPYQVFNKSQFWVGDIWLEDIIYIFIIGFSSALLLFKKKLRLMGFFVLIYMIAGVSIAHRDISRYLLPIVPFALISFERYLTSKEFKWVIAIVILGIYFYSQNFILNNAAPYPNVELFN